MTMEMKEEEAAAAAAAAAAAGKGRKWPSVLIVTTVAADTPKKSVVTPGIKIGLFG